MRAVPLVYEGSECDLSGPSAVCNAEGLKRRFLRRAARFYRGDNVRRYICIARTIDRIGVIRSALFTVRSVISCWD